MVVDQTQGVGLECHESAGHSLTGRRPSGVEIESRVKTTGRTGAEMEALTAVSVAALTIYDMCKAVDKQMVIGDVRLVFKAGGRGGTFQRSREAPPVIGA